MIIWKGSFDFYLTSLCFQGLRPTQQTMLRAGLHPRLSLHPHARTAVQPNRAARPVKLQQGEFPRQPPDPHARPRLLRRPCRLPRRRPHDWKVDGQNSGHRV